MPPDQTPPLAALRGRPYAVDLGPGPEPRIVLRRLSGRRHLAALWGRWFGGGVVAMWHPLRVLRAEHASEGWPVLAEQPSLEGPVDGLGGGWLACLGYARDTTWLGFYDFVLRRRPDDHWWLESLGLAGRDRVQRRVLAESRAIISAPDPGAETAGSYQVGTFTSCEPAPSVQAAYLAAVENVLGRIDRGDFYQINLCTRLRASFDGDPAVLFADAAARLRPDFAALLCWTDGDAVLSLSPERFLSVRGDRVLASPIKGTSAFSLDPTGMILRQSTKDAAENIMITDLMRNDLSRVCRPGTIAVSQLLGVERHPGVWHLVSSVTGSLCEGTTTAELLEATFPPGSVTGAPKISAMRAIDAVEPQPRGAYTGALGLVTPASGAELNVIIRSFEISPGRIELGVGGGITVDSVPVREWYECLHKAAPLLKAIGASVEPSLRPSPRLIPDQLRRAGVIETMLARRGKVLRLAAHLSRLDRSCQELYGSAIPDDLSTRVRQRAAADPIARLALRVTARPVTGGLDVGIESWALGPRPTSCTLVQRHRPAWSWRHKWAHRAALERADRQAHPAQPYFLAPEGHVAETSRGNLFCLGEDGIWRTPPADEHLLPGVTRREVLDTMAELDVPVRLERFSAEQLHQARAAFWVSSLSGLVVVDAVDGNGLASRSGIADELNLRLGFE